MKTIGRHRLFLTSMRKGGIKVDEVISLCTIMDFCSLHHNHAMHASS